MLKLIGNIERKEWEADCLEIELMKKLFKIESELDPVSILHLERLFHTLDGVADHAQDAGDRLRRMVAK